MLLIFDFFLSLPIAASLLNPPFSVVVAVVSPQPNHLLSPTVHKGYLVMRDTHLVLPMTTPGQLPPGTIPHPLVSPREGEGEKE